MAFVKRKYRCTFDHEWSSIVERGSPPPDECPMCSAIVAEIPPMGAPAPARSDTIGAPALRGRVTKAVARFEEGAFKRPHFDDGSPLLTNLRDNVRPGETHAVRETPSTNGVMRMMQEQEQQKTIVGANPSPWGFQPVNGTILQATGGASSPLGRPVVDLKSTKRA